MMKMKVIGSIRRALLLFVLCCAPVATSHAQLTRLSDLNFGTVFPGVSKSVMPSSSNAAGFKFPILLLTLGITINAPTQLVRSGGTETLNVSYGPQYGTFISGNADRGATPSGTFNPAGGSVIGLGLFLLATMHVYIGGQVNPTSTQAAGTYTGVLTITVAAL